jgi:DNA-binding NarL/FixJ family response regulator
MTLAVLERTLSTARPERERWIKASPRSPQSDPPVPAVSSAGTAGDDLTPHEARILELFAEGHSYKTAAAEIVSPGTTCRSTCGA